MQGGLTPAVRRPLLAPPVAGLLRSPLGAFPLQRTQRITLAAFAVVGAVMAVLIVVRAPWEVVRWSYTPPIVALVVLALIARPRTPTQVGATVALGLSALGDAFLCGFVPVPGEMGRLAGIGTFALAYVVVTVTFWRGRPRPVEAATGVVLVGWAGALCVVLWPTVPAALQAVVVVFAGIIALMTWTAVGTLTRGRFPARVAVWVATMGVLVFGSDTLVALTMFHPAFSPLPVPVELVLRATYLAGWLLILLVVQRRPAVRPR